MKRKSFYIILIAIYLLYLIPLPVFLYIGWNLFLYNILGPFLSPTESVIANLYGDGSLKYTIRPLLLIGILFIYSGTYLVTLIMSIKKKTISVLCLFPLWHIFIAIAAFVTFWWAE